MPTDHTQETKNMIQPTQPNESTNFLSAKEALLGAMRHHTIIQSLKQSRVSAIVGYDAYENILDDDQIDAVCEAEATVEAELKYWESLNAVNQAKVALIEASKPLIDELVPAEHLESVKELYKATNHNVAARHKLANLLLRWKVE